jgi:hypothetical protein
MHAVMLSKFKSQKRGMKAESSDGFFCGGRILLLSDDDSVDDDSATTLQLSHSDPLALQLFLAIPTVWRHGVTPLFLAIPTVWRHSDL